MKHGTITDLNENMPVLVDTPSCSPDLLAPWSLFEGEREEEEKQKEGENKVALLTGTEEETKLPKKDYYGLKKLCCTLCALEQALYLTLPVWIQGALLCNLMAHLGLTGVHDNFFPERLISYLLLPYTLPAKIIISSSFRLLLWLKHLQQDALFLWQNIKQIVWWFTGTPSSCLKKHLSDRLLSAIFVDPTQKDPTEQGTPGKASLVRQRSVLHVQLSTSSSCMDAPPESLGCSFLFNLKLFILELNPSPGEEVGNEATSSYISPYMSLEGMEEEVERTFQGGEVNSSGLEVPTPLDSQNMIVSPLNKNGLDNLAETALPSMKSR